MFLSPLKFTEFVEWFETIYNIERTGKLYNYHGAKTRYHTGINRSIIKLREENIWQGRRIHDYTVKSKVCYELKDQVYVCGVWQLSLVGGRYSERKQKNSVRRAHGRTHISTLTTARWHSMSNPLRNTGDLILNTWYAYSRTLRREHLKSYRHSMEFSIESTVRYESYGWQAVL